MAEELKILLKIPTRGRGLKHLYQWWEKAHSPNNIEMIVSVDNDEGPELEAEFSIQILPVAFYHSNIYASPRTNKIHAFNRDIDKAKTDWDILVIGQDDLKVMQDWDKIIRDAFADRDLYRAKWFDTEPDEVTSAHPRAKKFRKGSPQFLSSFICMHTVMGRYLYEDFGYVYNPIYKNFGCDDEYTHVCRHRGVIDWVGKRPYMHIHASYPGGIPNDQVYQDAVPTIQTDHQTFHRRLREIPNEEKQRRMQTEEKKKRGRKPKQTPVTVVAYDAPEIQPGEVVSLMGVYDPTEATIQVPPTEETERVLSEMLDGADYVLAIQDKNGHKVIKPEPTSESLYPWEAPENITLSVCILSIPEHAAGAIKVAAQLGVLVEGLTDGINRFVSKVAPLEVLIYHSPKLSAGGPTRGFKRNELLKEARGTYVVSIDADDFVADDYAERILAALESGPDCVGFKIHCKNGDQEVWAIASKRFLRWTHGWTLGGSGYIERTPYHKTPIKTEIARKAGGFREDLDVGEDHDYSIRCLPILKTEVYIDEFLYFYWK